MIQDILVYPYSCWLSPLLLQSSLISYIYIFILITVDHCSYQCDIPEFWLANINYQPIEWFTTEWFLNHGFLFTTSHGPFGQMLLPRNWWTHGEPTILLVIPTKRLASQPKKSHQLHKPTTKWTHGESAPVSRKPVTPPVTPGGTPLQMSEQWGCQIYLGWWLLSITTVHPIRSTMVFKQWLQFIIGRTVLNLYGGANACQRTANL